MSNRNRRRDGHPAKRTINPDKRIRNLERRLARVEHELYSTEDALAHVFAQGPAAIALLSERTVELKRLLVNAEDLYGLPPAAACNLIDGFMVASAARRMLAEHEIEYLRLNPESTELDHRLPYISADFDAGDPETLVDKLINRRAFLDDLDREIKDALVDGHGAAA